MNQIEILVADGSREKFIIEWTISGDEPGGWTIYFFRFWVK